MTSGLFGIIPARVAGLRLPGRACAVLIAIASHARKERKATVSLDAIAAATGIERSKVPACIRRLEANGILVVNRGGGRERASTYRIIPDDEVGPAEGNRTAETGDGRGAVSSEKAATGDNEIVTDSKENGVISGSQTVLFSVPNAAAGGNPTEKRDRTESPLRGGRARMSGRDRFRSGSVGRQAARLSPLNGKGDGSGANPSVENYQPGDKIIDWARENVPGVDPLDSRVLGRFRDYHLSRSTKLGDLDAAYRLWLASEPEFRRRRGGDGFLDTPFGPSFSNRRGATRPAPSLLLKSLLEEARGDDD